jgi:hypothetical protein
MQKPIGRVPFLPSLLQAYDSFPNFMMFLDLEP